MQSHYTISSWRDPLATCLQQVCSRLYGPLRAVLLGQYVLQDSDQLKPLIEEEYHQHKVLYTVSIWADLGLSARQPSSATRIRRDTELTNSKVGSPHSQVTLHPPLHNKPDPRLKLVNSYFRATTPSSDIAQRFGFGLRKEKRHQDLPRARDA